MRIGYLGPEGTVSQAALAAFSGWDPADASGRGVPMPTLRDTVLAVQDGRLDRAMVPIENSREGPVNPVWDTIALEAPAVRLLAEHVQPVSYCLAAAAGVAGGLRDVRTVHSHPQAAAQCTRWLAEHVPAASVVAAASTADAIRAVAASGDPAVAAIGLRFAAERYGARILADGLEDESGNATRFALIAGSQADGDGAAAAAGSNGERTVLVFWGERDDSPGWLVACLAPFSERGINLTRIVSRPLRGRRMGHYMFFLECDGLEGEDPVAGALADLRGRAETVRVLGSYSLAA